MELSADPNESIRWSVAMNASIPDDAMFELIVRLGLAANPKVSPEVLRNLAEDIAISVRRKIAANPNTEPLILGILADDAKRLEKHIEADREG